MGSPLARVQKAKPRLGAGFCLLATNDRQGEPRPAGGRRRGSEPRARGLESLGVWPEANTTIGPSPAHGNET